MSRTVHAVLPPVEWLERVHNNRALVPDHGEYMARWARESDQVRREIACDLDVPYGSHSSERLDIFLPRASGNALAPVFVFLHGGYWRALDKSDHSFVAQSLVPAGACVVVPNYALCPEVTVPHITWQMARALAWTWRHIRAYGGDPDRIVVAGHSAGGQLAAMMMVCQWRMLDPTAPLDLVKSALAISGLYELNRVAATPSLQASLRLSPQDVARCSPAWLPAPRTGKVYCVAGGDESEEYHRLNHLLQQRWGQAVVPKAELLSGDNHFSILQGLCSPKKRLHQLAMELLTQ